MNIIDEMRLRGGLPTEAELRFETEIVRRARERATPPPPRGERMRLILVSSARRLTRRVARLAASRPRTS